MNKVVSPPFIPAQPIPAETVAEVATWLEPTPRGFMPPLAERGAWDSTGLNAASVIGTAVEAASHEVPALPDEMYLDFMVSGRREPFLALYDERIHRAARLALAEALEDRGRLLAPLERLLRAILAEKTWVYPMQDGHVGYASI